MKHDSTDEPREFSTRQDGVYSDTPEGEDAPFLFNPAASPETLLCAAQGRAGTLHQSLLQWAHTDRRSPIEAALVAEALEPVAEEITLLLEELARRMREARKASK